MYFLDHQDGLVEYGLPLRRDLARVLRLERPDIVITINFDLNWGDSGISTMPTTGPPGWPHWTRCGTRPTRGCSRRPRPEQRQADVRGRSGDPTHFVNVTETIDAGVASLREHKAYLDGLGRDFDPDEFLRNMAGYLGLAAGSEYAVGFRRYSAG